MPRPNTATHSPRRIPASSTPFSAIDPICEKIPWIGSRPSGSRFSAAADSSMTKLERCCQVPNTRSPFRTLRTALPVSLTAPTSSYPVPLG